MIALVVVMVDDDGQRFPTAGAAKAAIDFLTLEMTR